MKHLLLILMVLMTLSSLSSAEDITITPDNVTDLQLLDTLGYGRPVSIAIHDEKIAIGTYHGVLLYDNRDAEPRFLLPEVALLRQVVFSPDGTILITAGAVYAGGTTDMQAVLYGWDTTTGELLFSYVDDQELLFVDVAISTDGTKLLAGGYGRRMLMWELASIGTTPPQEVDFSETEELARWVFVTLQVSLSADGSIGAAVFYSLSLDNSNIVYVWDTATGEVLLSLDETMFDIGVHDVLLSDDGESIIVSNTVWDVQTGSKLADSEDYVWRLQRTDGFFVTAGAQVRLYDSLAALIDETPEWTMTIDQEYHDVQAVDVTSAGVIAVLYTSFEVDLIRDGVSDDRWSLVSESEEELNLINLINEENARTHTEDGIFNVDNTAIARVSETEDVIQIVDVASGDVRFELSMNEFVDAVDISWSPMNDLIAGIDNHNRLYIWDAQTGERLYEYLLSYSFSDFDIAFMSNQIIATTHDGLTVIWGIPQ